MKISREHNLFGSSVFIKNQTPIKVWPLRSELSVFTQSFEPLTRSPTKCNNACFLHSAGLKTYDLITLESKMYSESTWLWTVYTTLANATRRDWLSCKMISSTTGFKSFPHSHSIHSFYRPSGFPCWPLILTQTTANIIDARHYNPSPSSLILTLLDMHTPSKARIPQVLIIPRHEPFISPLQSYLAKLLAQRKNYNNQPSSAITRSLHLSFSHIYVPNQFF